MQPLGESSELIFKTNLITKLAHRTHPKTKTQLQGTYRLQNKYHEPSERILKPNSARNLQMDIQNSSSNPMQYNYRGTLYEGKLLRSES